MNHKWNKDNVCSKCGLHRKMKYWCTLMAVVNHPPWEAWRREMAYGYFRQGDKTITQVRPDCITNLKHKNHEQLEQTQK